MGITKFVCLGIAVCAGAAFAQAGLAQQSPSKEPVAYVYVASTPVRSSVNQIEAYAAASDGRLTPVPGSPYPEAVTSMAVNGVYLMAASQTSPDINAYRIEPDGSLASAAVTDYARHNPSGCGSAGQVYLDHTGADLYIQEYDFDCANTGVASFAIDKSNGGLKYLGMDNMGAFPGNFTAAYFIGDNDYAYTADQSGCMYYSVYGFRRHGSGLLSSINEDVNLPAPPSSFTRYIPYLSAADPTNHVAFVMLPGHPPGCTSDPLQLASYTADAKGNLTTNDSYATMPDTRIVNPNDLKMAPSGKLLAIAGQEGLQVFHFNGAHPITAYTGLLTTDPINQMFWDKHNHLYAISQSTGRLHVFTITPDEHHEVTGSPYAIDSPDDLIVQPWPLPWS